MKSYLNLVYFILSIILLIASKKAITSPSTEIISLEEYFLTEINIIDKDSINITRINNPFEIDTSSFIFYPLSVRNVYT